MARIDLQIGFAADPTCPARQDALQLTIQARPGATMQTVLRQALRGAASDT